MGVELVDYPESNPKPLNGSQFSQGTLFQQPKPTAEHQWASHGYSPERRDAIAALIPNRGTTVGVSSQWTGGSLFPSFQEMNPQRSGRASISASRQTNNQRTATRNALVDTISRSTVPVEDLATNTPKFKIGPAPDAGRYRVRPFSREKAIIQINPGGRSGRDERPQMEHIVIHELGHHADYESDRQGFVDRYTSESRVRAGPPSMEGAAEGYADKHRVRRRDDPTEYKDVAGYKTLQRHEAFQQHFEKVSGRSIQEAMGTTETLAAPTGESGMQQRLFTGSEESSYVKDENELLSTIRTGRGNGPWMWGHRPVSEVV